MTNALFKPKSINVQEYGGSVCSECGQPIAEGQMVSWQGGDESHVTCPPPKEQDQEWKSPILMPKKPGQPGQESQQPTGQHPEVHQPSRQYSSKKNAVAHVPWDVYLNGKWINRVYTERGLSVEIVKQSLVNHDAYNPAIEVQPGTVVAPASVPHNRLEKVGSRTDMHYARIRPSHAFAVPSASSNAVAMALAEAGMKDFEVATDDDIGASYFSFPTPAEKEVAIDIVAEKFAPQIILW